MGPVRVIAYYLPQYHPIPENDQWWGKGFTEWTNVAKARPLFPGHKQPHLPSDLGYYDLRVPEVRELQADMARNAGIEGFCYWHYWFGNGRRLLERPFNEVLMSGKPDFPFCLAWANESWSGLWTGAGDRMLMKQEYPGRKDYEEHFNAILPAFLDKRYIRVGNKPLFMVYNPAALPDMREFTDLFRELALKNGLEDIFLIANNYKNVTIDWDPGYFGFDAYTTAAHSRIMHELTPEHKGNPGINVLDSLRTKVIRRLARKQPGSPAYVYSYEDASKYFLLENKFQTESFPTIISGWDNSPRCGVNGLILTGYNPDVFRIHVREAIEYSGKTRDRLLFIKSWNEWAEGNYLEPEAEFGTQFLEVLREELANCSIG